VVVAIPDRGERNGTLMGFECVVAPMLLGDDGGDFFGCKYSTFEGSIYVEIIHMRGVNSKGIVGGDPP